MKRNVKESGIATAATGAVLFIVGGLWVYALLQSSLPVLDGERTVPALRADVQIARDHLGVVTVDGKNREDVARALGYVHAQERFFQMDLLRRTASGELAELFGPVALDMDKRVRFHGLRQVAQAEADALSGEQRLVLQAYTEGVNTGLAQLGSDPFEYVMLRQQPRPWQLADSFLVALAMFLDLQDDRGERHGLMALLSQLYPKEVVAFLVPQDTEWDAPLRGQAGAPRAIPTSEVFNPRSTFAPLAPRQQRAQGSLEDMDIHAAASNSWAVDGKHSAHRGAILAGDMHLTLRVPNIWFRAQLRWLDASTQQPRVVTGATLPGGPIVVAGSNTKVAWAFTNSYVDTAELVALEMQTLSQPGYRTPEGWSPLQTREERIVVKGANAQVITVPVSRWGPVRVLASGVSVAVRWVGHHADAVNFLGLMDLERAATVEQALDAAQRAGIPAQNIVVADDQGKIGWTIAGQVPRRKASLDQPLVDWRDADQSWTGWFSSEETPRVVAPENGRLWTANNRLSNDAQGALLGDGGYVLGARARQIRDDLYARDAFSEADMLGIQLDDRALFLTRWRTLLLETLDDEAVRDHPSRAALRALVAGWSGRAAVEDPGYRMVRAFRLFLAADVFDVVLNQAQRLDASLPYQRFTQWEAPLWHIVTTRPPHLLHPDLSSWREQFLATVDRVITFFEQSGKNLADHTWGERNRLAMSHPFAVAVPWMAKWLNMPATPLPGDEHMPRVQGPMVGSSQRMIVAPGHETQGIFHMPGGQSGHILSPYYRAGHEAWERGVALPFLPGSSEHQLVLTPHAPTLPPWWRDAESN